MKIPFKTLDFHPKSRVVGCGVQGSTCLALEVTSGRGGRWAITWSLEGDLGDAAFAKELSKRTGKHAFWVSPAEEGGLQVETAKVIEIPSGVDSNRAPLTDFFLTQIKNRFVNETVVFGGTRIRAAGVREGVSVKEIHNVGGGAIKDNVQRDYLNWYSKMGIRRPHIASSALALANAYLALYPQEKRLAHPMRMVVLKGRSTYRVVLMDDWKYMDEVLLPRMEGDDSTREVIEARVNGWIEYFGRLYPQVTEKGVTPLVVAVKEQATSAYEHWDLWGEGAMEKIDMTGPVADPILRNRDIAPIAFGMALQGGC